MQDFPPPYSIRTSPRARNVLLRILPRQGLEVVAPEGFDLGRVPAIVAARRDWIERTLRRLAERGVETAPVRPALPDRLDFPAEGLSFEVLTAPGPGRAALVENAGRLLLRGRTDDLPACLALLRRFVRDRAGLLLPLRARRISRAAGLPFEAVRVRLQKSRWGSCSAAGLLNLNAKLLFLPPELCDHVILHELCHTRHMNHGPRFKALLARLDPEAAARDRELRSAGRFVPAWLENGVPRASQD